MGVRTSERVHRKPVVQYFAHFSPTTGAIGWRVAVAVLGSLLLGASGLAGTDSASMAAEPRAVSTSADPSGTGRGGTPDRHPNCPSTSEPAGTSFRPSQAAHLAAASRPGVHRLATVITLFRGAVGDPQPLRPRVQVPRRHLDSPQARRGIQLLARVETRVPVGPGARALDPLVAPGMRTGSTVLRVLPNQGGGWDVPKPGSTRALGVLIRDVG